jgi:restriction system protein
VLRESLGIDRSHFSHEYSSELLRAAVVATISAIDRYMHDIVVYHCWKLLSLPEDKIPSQLRKLSIPVIDAKKATENCRRDQSSRPGHSFKKAIQQHLHKDFTFQKPDDLVKAAKMLGIEDFWGKVSQKFQVNHTKQDIINKLRVISRRRNQIVHEADLILKTKAKKLTLREIDSNEALDWVDWMDELGRVIDKVIADAIYKPRVKRN